MAIDQITPVMYQNALNQLAEMGYSYSTISKARTVIYLMMQSIYGCREVHLKIPSKAPVKKIYPLDDNEQRIIEQYHQEKERVCRKIKRTYHELGGIVGHRSMKVLLARENTFLSKTTIHKYMKQDLKLHCVCKKRKSGYQKCPYSVLLDGVVQILNMNYQLSWISHRFDNYHYCCAYICRSLDDH